MPRFALLLALLVLLPAGLVACGGDDDDDAGGGGGTTTTTEESTGGGGGGGEATGDTVAITIKDFAFDPADATAKVGQKVMWTNEDDAPHNAVGGPIKTDTVDKGGTIEFTPTEAGKIDYICTVHPQMKATLTVTE